MTECAVGDEFCEGLATKWCYLCGMPVCTHCSCKRDHRAYGRVLMCNCCQIIYDGSDAVVVARRLKLAGYSYKARRQMLQERYGSVAK